MESGKFIEKRKNNMGAQILTGAGIVGAVGVADALDGKIDGFGLFAKSNTTNTPNEPPKSAGQSVPPQSSETAVPPVTNSSSETSSTNSEVVPTSIYDLSSGPIVIDYDKNKTLVLETHLKELEENNSNLEPIDFENEVLRLYLGGKTNAWYIDVYGSSKDKRNKQDEIDNSQLIVTVQNLDEYSDLKSLINGVYSNISIDPSVSIEDVANLLYQIHQDTSGEYYYTFSNLDSKILPKQDSFYSISFPGWDESDRNEVLEYIQTLKHPISAENYSNFLFHDNAYLGLTLSSINYNDFVVEDVEGSNINPDIGDGVKDFFQKYIQDISKLDKDGDEKLIWSESYITREGDNYILKTTDNFDDNEISLIEFSNLTPEAIEYLESEFMSQEEYNSQLGIEDDSKNSDTTLLPDPVLDTEWNEEYVLYLSRFEYLWRKLTDDSNNNGISDSTGKILYSPKVGIPVELYSEHLELNSENSFIEDLPTLLIGRDGYEEFIGNRTWMKNDPNTNTVYNENFVEVPETLELYVSKIGEIGGNFDENGKFIYHPDLAEFGVYLDYNDDGFCDFSPEVKIPEGSYTVTGEEIYYHN